MGGNDNHDGEERRAQAFLQEAYALETESDCRDFYQRWAQDYDAQLERGLHYIAPRVLAEALAKHQTSGEHPILDVGCGTGLTCCCLRKLGFRTIDGIDISRAMLEKAGEKRVYRNLIAADLNKPLPFVDAVYAAAISTGTFTLGHVGAEPIDELLRVLEPGAHFACTVHAAVWDARGFSRKFSELERSGAIHTIEQHTGHFFEGGEPTALYCVFQVGNVP